MLVLSAFFSSAALSSDCEKIFDKLDKRHIPNTDEDYNKKIIRMESDIFAGIEKCKVYAGMFVLMGELQIEMGQIPLAVVYGKKSVELDGDYWRAHKLLGSAKMLNNESEDGLISLKKAVVINKTKINKKINFIREQIMNEKDTLAIAYYFRSQIHKRKGLIKEANEDAKKAQEMGFALEQRL